MHIPLVFATEHVLILLSWLYVLQEQVKLIITAVVIDPLMGASSDLVSGLLAVFQTQVLLIAYDFYMLTFTRISWILMSGVWLVML